MAGQGRVPQARRRSGFGLASLALVTAFGFAPVLGVAATGAGASVTPHKVTPPPAQCTTDVPIAAGTTVTGSITTAGQNDCYSFAAKQSDRVRVRVVATSGTLEPSTEIIGIKGSPICGPSTAGEQTCVVVNKGTQTIDVQDAAGTNTGDYTVSVQFLKKPLACAALAFGSPSQTGTISAPGALDCYTFKAHSGARLLTRIVATSGTVAPSVEVLNSNGNTVCGPATDLEQSCRLTSGGSQSVFVRDLGSGTGDFTLYAQLNKTKGCAAVKFGRNVFGAITAAGTTDCYRFGGTNGEHFRIGVVASNGSLVANTEVLRSNGTTLCASTDHEQTCRVTSDGAETILISDLNGTGSGSYTLFAQRLDAPLGCKPLTYGADPITGSISSVGAWNCYTYDGTAGTGTHLQVFTTSGTIQPNFEIIKPNGNDFEDGNCDVNATDERCLLGVTGQYMVLVRDLSGTNTGTYTIAITERIFT